MDGGGQEEGHRESTVAEALQFLLVAAAVLLLVRFAHAIGAWALTPGESDALGHLASPLRRGYLLRDPHLLVPDGMSVAGRVAMAVLVGMAGGASGAIIGRWLAIAFSVSAVTGWRYGLRIGLSVVTAWSILAALLWPPVALRISDDSVAIIKRPSLIGAISLPWPARTQDHAWSSCDLHWTRTANDKPALMIHISGEQHRIDAAEDDEKLNRFHAFARDRIQRAIDQE